jgi:predicted porin
MPIKILLVFSSLLTWLDCYAAEWTLKPIANPSISYDDNELMSTTNKQGSFQFSIKPTLEAGFKQENVDIAVSAGYSISRYTHLSRLDQDNPFLEISSSMDTERSEVDLRLSYSENASRNTAAEDTGNFASSSITTTRSIFPTYVYRLTERDSITFSGGYIEREYSTAEFDDNESTTLSTSWQRQFSERLNGNASISYSLYEAGNQLDGSENDTYNLSFGADYFLSERWSFGGQIGARYLDSEQRSLGVISSNSSSGTSFNIDISYKTEFDTFLLTVSQALNPSSTGDVNEQQSFSLSWIKTLSETLDFKIDTSFRETSTVSNSDDDKRENISIKPSLSWNFSPQGSASINYQYRQQKRDSQQKAESNAIFLAISYNWDGFRVSR